MLTLMGTYNEELVNACVMRAGEGLRATSNRARVVFEGREKRVVDGPFAGSSGLVAGYWIFDVQSKQEAVEWVKRAPFGEFGDERVEVEIRQIFQTEDFAPSDPTGELRKQEHALREKVVTQTK